MKGSASKQYVIISYANQNAALAQQVCQRLEKAHIKCWIAPRDVTPGSDYAEEIMNAITGSSAMLIILSSQSNKSPHVKREVERAVSKGIAIIPFAIEPVKLSKSMEYYVSSQHWLEAGGHPAEKHYQRLIETIRQIMQDAGKAGAAEAEESEVVGVHHPHAGSGANEGPSGQRPGALWPKLAERRVPQIVGGYLAAAIVLWGAALALCGALGLSPHLPTFVLATLLLLSPSVFALTYYSHAATKTIVAAANIVLAAGLLYLLFHGKELGTMTESVSITNEQGQRVQMEIPKPEFRKKLFISYFDNESSDTSLNWLQYAIPRLVEFGLSQDYYISTNTPMGYSDEIIAAGFPKGVKLPLSLVQKTAQKWGWRNFVTGTVNTIKGGYEVAVTVYQTDKCNVIDQSRFSGTDIFALADEISARLKTSLGLPESHIKGTKVLPVRELTTRSPQAFRDYAIAKNFYYTIGNDHVQCIRYLEKAAREDSTFAYAYMRLYYENNAVQNYAGAQQAVKNLMKYSYKLTEDDKYNAKLIYYGQFDPPKVFELAKLWVEASPFNVDARTNLGWEYYDHDQREKAINEFKRAYELDPGQLECLKWIGWIYEWQGDYGNSSKYLKRYAAGCPENVESFSEIANLFESSGDFDQARRYFNKALMLDPENIDAQLNVASLGTKTGHCAGVQEQEAGILAICKSAGDSAKIYEGLSDYYETRGMMKKMIEALEQYHAVFSRGKTPYQVSLYKLFNTYKYAKAGQINRGQQMLQQIERSLPSSDHFLLSLYGLYFYSELNDTLNIARYADEMEKVISQQRHENLRDVVTYGRGRLAEIKANYKEAVGYFSKNTKKSPGSSLDNMYLGRCYRKTGDLKKAEQCLAISLKKEPFDADYNYEMALVYADMGKKDKAIACLNKSIEIWAEADPDYQPAQKAREKLAELTK